MKQDEEKEYITKQAYRRRYQNPKGESRSQLFEHGFPLTHRNHKTETQREVNTPRKERKKTDIVCVAVQEFVETPRKHHAKV